MFTKFYSVCVGWNLKNLLTLTDISFKELNYSEISYSCYNLRKINLMRDATGGIEVL